MIDKKYTTERQIEKMRQEILIEKQKMIQLQQSGRYRIGAMSRSAAKIVSWFIFSAIVLILVSTIISVNLAKSRGEIPSVARFQLFHVETGSMEPTLPIGTVIISRVPKDPHRLNKNTIITFKTTSGAVVTHRIIAIVTMGDQSVMYQTKGDNPRNAIDPELLAPDRVIGVFMARVPLS